MTPRIAHAAQSGSRLSAFDTLFETVPMVEQHAYLAPDELPQPDVTEVEWQPALFEAKPGSAS